MPTADLRPAQDSAVLAVLAQSDPSPWCFLPSDPSRDVDCSSAFASLWNLSSAAGRHVSGMRSVTRTAISAAMSRQGIPGADFLAMTSRGQQDTSPVLVRRDLSDVRVEVKAVLAGKQIIGHLLRFTESVRQSVLESLMHQITSAQRQLEILSPREREILHLVYEGRTNKAISIATKISEKTVEKHRARTMQKLRVKCTAELFRLVSKAWMLSDILGPEGNEPCTSASSAPLSSPRPSTAGNDE